jgi:hypothetical protein
MFQNTDLSWIEWAELEYEKEVEKVDEEFQRVTRHRICRKQRKLR